MTVISIEDLKRDNKTAAEWLLYYEFRKTAYQHDYLDTLTGRQPMENIGRSRSGVGNPTLLKLIGITDLIHTENWFKTIEDVYRILGEKKLIFLAVRREALTITSRSRERGRPAWVPYVQRRCTEELIKRYGLNKESCPSERVLTEWWRQIVKIGSN